MASDLTIERFRHHEGQTFHAHHPAGEECGASEAEPVPLELVEVDDLSAAFPVDASSEESRRSPFGLIFRGRHEHTLPSGPYRITNPELGEYQLFLTPVQTHLHGQTADAVYYEVTFG